MMRIALATGGSTAFYSARFGIVAMILMAVLSYALECGIRRRSCGIGTKLLGRLDGCIGCPMGSDDPLLPKKPETAAAMPLSLPIKLSRPSVIPLRSGLMKSSAEWRRTGL
jgi:hypothetical protein